MQPYYLKFLVISCFISLAAACGIQQSGNQTSNVTNVQVSVPFSYLITGCAAEKEVKSKTNVAAAEPLMPEELTVKVKGDSVLYIRNVTHLCCRKAKLSTKIKDSSITITEYWYRQGCKCKCSSTIEAVVNKLAKANYSIIIVETGTDPVNDKPILTKDTIWKGFVTIK